MKVAIPSNAPGGLEATISPHFGRCDVFTIVEIKDGKVVSASTIDNRGTHFGFDKAPAEILASRGVDVILTQGMGPKAMQLFAQSGIAVYMTSAKTVEEAVRELIEDKAKLASLEDACKEARESTRFSPPSCLHSVRGWGWAVEWEEEWGGEWDLVLTGPLTRQRSRQRRTLHNQC